MIVWIADNMVLIAKLFTLKTLTLECYPRSCGKDVRQITLEKANVHDMKKAATLAMF
jgi:hypothetical protein